MQTRLELGSVVMAVNSNDLIATFQFESRSCVQILLCSRDFVLSSQEQAFLPYTGDQSVAYFLLVLFVPWQLFPQCPILEGGPNDEQNDNE
jgi:hypothetical protein